MSDTGVGIDPDTLARLFRPFAQAERSLSRTMGGLGLGLALVKGLVELHGGTVSAVSPGPGRGARFTVTLPVAARGPFDSAETPSSRAAAVARKVVVIDDNRDSADTLADALALSGHYVVVAYDGSTGVEKAREFQPDVVVCDIGLPDLDGYQVVAALRKHSETSSSFLVALSGYAQPEDQRRALDAGFDAHLAKPPNMDELEHILERAPERLR